MLNQGGTAEDGMTIRGVSHEMGFAPKSPTASCSWDSGQIIEANTPRSSSITRSTSGTKLFPESQILH